MMATYGDIVRAEITRNWSVNSTSQSFSVNVPDQTVDLILIRP